MPAERNGGFRLLAVDVDGTLVTPDKRLLPEVRLALRHAGDCGLAVSLVTGRMFSAVAGWVQELGLRSPQICNNGADLVDPATGELLQNLCLPPGVVPVVLRIAEELGVTTAVFSGARVLVLRRTPDHWLIERNNEPVEVVDFATVADPALRAEKLLFLDLQNPGRFPALREELAGRIAAAALPACSLEITEPGILNIAHPEASKGVALRHLVERCGMTLDEVAAIGDGDNDATMVGLAGLGIAMGNATSATRQAASVTVPDNWQVGVVPAILEHVLAPTPLTGAGLLAARLRELRLCIRQSGSALVAFSGGVDSTLVMKLAVDELGDRALAVTARSAVFPAADFDRACELARGMGARHEVLSTDEQNETWYATHPPDRCYVCKKAFFSRLVELAQSRGLAAVIDGENADDLSAHRPGEKAARECGVRSPLAEVGLTKSDVRRLSRECGLANWNLPANACLATRFPYGERLTRERLAAVERAEVFLHGIGLPCVRVRGHGSTARIEVPVDRFADVVSRRDPIAARVKACGFRFVTLDLEGYRTGSMD